MSSTADPQTDREWMMQLSGDINGLRKSIETLAEKIEIFEEKKLLVIEDRIKTIDLWISGWGGVWKFILIGSAVLAALSVIISIVIRFI